MSSFRIHCWFNMSSSESGALQLTETDPCTDRWWNHVPVLGFETFLCIKAQRFSQLRTSFHHPLSRIMNEGKERLGWGSSPKRVLHLLFKKFISSRAGSSSYTKAGENSCLAVWQNLLKFCPYHLFALWPGRSLNLSDSLQVTIDFKCRQSTVCPWHSILPHGKATMGQGGGGM